MSQKMLYKIKEEKHNEKDLKRILADYPEIKFVSFVGIDLSGNDTDEKIPVNLFLDDLDSFLHGVAVQTDGSSVVLPGIATLNNAKVDMVADLNCKWFVDYNYDFIDYSTNKPVGTLRIPCFLVDNSISSPHSLTKFVSEWGYRVSGIGRLGEAIGCSQASYRQEARERGKRRQS